MRLAVILGCALLAQQASAQSPLATASGQTINGISCDAQEGQRIHIHQRLLIIDRGKTVPIPRNVGQPANVRCIYWVHTHTPDGIIHVEAPKDRSFTLGDFFSVWGQPLSRTVAATARARTGQTLKVWVDGKAYHGDPARIALTAHEDIVIETGPPYPKVKPYGKWGNL